MLSHNSTIAMTLVTVCTAIENFNKFSGISLNLLLLYLIAVYSRKSLGTYKYLLFTFACSDVLLTLVHIVINHQIVSVGTTFACIGSTFAESRHFTAIYCSSFTLAFCLSIFNFLYRLFSVKYPHLVSLFSNKFFIALLVMVATSTFFSWYLLCIIGTRGGIDEIGTIVAREVYFLRFGRNLTDGFQVLDHWRDGQFMVREAVVLLVCDAMIISCITFAGALAVICFYHISKADKMSEQSKQLQAKLLKTLCAQTAVPITCVFIPYFTVLTMPFLAIDGGFLNVGCTACISFFPTLDAVVIIWLMTDYREGLKSMIRGKKTSVSAIDHGNTKSHSTGMEMTME
ncbi:hypothetical protein PRIPAC_81845 [Pristionchus pacificus]|uniref:G protein-coupled receptor n=1 Tax=Pristionchus pacificus TaxID=54126 RepID=A0A2A6CMT2_PRIPA|nr:hypothetical protein PRIPAC_81845 [Pristionchus pacificus]|eukprot:PDM79397.1 G protein-coupled receptor [Pristionchus pacificus]